MTAEPAISGSGPQRRAVRLTPLQVPKASDVLADDLRERILRGDFPEGTALPPERELVNQTRMSRATIREALRILEVQGLVRIKTGRAGGAYVSRPGHNELLTGFMRALSRAIYASTDNQGFVDDDVRQTTLRAHRAVTKAIQAKDPDAARRRMSRHVHSYAEAVIEVEDRTSIEVPEN